MLRGVIQQLPATRLSDLQFPSRHCYSNDNQKRFRPTHQPIITTAITVAPQRPDLRENIETLPRTQASTSRPTPITASGNTTIPTGLNRNASINLPLRNACEARVIPQPGHSSPVNLLKKQPGIQPAPPSWRSWYAANATNNTPKETQIARSLCINRNFRSYCPLLLAARLGYR